MSRIKLTTNKGTMYPVDLNHLTYSEAVEELNLLEQRTPHDTYEPDRQGENVLCLNYPNGDFELYEIEEIDYFEVLADFDNLPDNIQAKLLPVYEVINAPDETWTPIIQEGDSSYKGCSDLLNALETIGWTCDYGLDGTPIDLQPL